MTTAQPIPWAPWALDRVESLAVRMAAFGSVAAATGLVDMVSRMGDELRADDGGGNWVRLLRNDDRVTVLAWDRDDPPLLPALAGAAVNAWTPRPLPVEPVSFVGVGSLTRPGCWHLAEHDPGEVMSAFLSDDASALEMDDFLSQCGDDEGVDCSTSRPLLGHLVRHPFGDSSVLTRIAAPFGLSAVEAGRSKLAELASWWPPTTV